MNHQTILTVLVATTLLALAPHAGATHPDSEGECPAHTQYVPTDSETTSYPVYLMVDELVSNDYLYSIWVYAESNGVDGVQRDDDYCYTPGFDTATSDTIIF